MIGFGSFRCGDLSRSQNGTSACYVSNHGAGVTFEGTVTLTAYDHFGTGAGVVVMQKPLAMAAGPGALEWFNADLCGNFDIFFIFLYYSPFSPHSSALHHQPYLVPMLIGG